MTTETILTTEYTNHYVADRRELQFRYPAKLVVDPLYINLDKRDHKLPLSLLPEDTMDNLQGFCLDENTQRIARGIYNMMKHQKTTAIKVGNLYISTNPFTTEK